MSERERLEVALQAAVNAEDHVDAAALDRALLSQTIQPVCILIFLLPFISMHEVLTTYSITNSTEG